MSNGVGSGWTHVTFLRTVGVRSLWVLLLHAIVGASREPLLHIAGVALVSIE